VLIASVELEGIRTVCAVPMLKGDETVGVLTLYRREIEAFEDDDIELVRTFTDQAVIAIENVRLFRALQARTTDLTKSLERQTATSEILRSISRSPTAARPPITLRCSTPSSKTPAAFVTHNSRACFGCATITCTSTPAWAATRSSWTSIGQIQYPSTRPTV